MDKMKFTKEREIETMTIEGHCRGSDERHDKERRNKVKKNVIGSC